MKIEDLKPGMTVYDCHSHKMGNTTMSTLGTWRVYINGVDLEAGIVEARWNGNIARRYSKRQWSKWTAEPPLLITNAMGIKRRATREEKKAHQLAQAAKEQPVSSPTT